MLRMVSNRLVHAEQLMRILEWNTWCRAVGAVVLSLGWLADAPRAMGQNHAEAPRAHDPALEVELFAAAPDIVHPIGVAFDQRGRLLVIESHTHFRPKDYKGPAHD